MKFIGSTAKCNLWFSPLKNFFTTLLLGIIEPILLKFDLECQKSIMRQILNQFLIPLPCRRRSSSNVLFSRKQDVLGKVLNYYLCLLHWTIPQKLRSIRNLRFCQNAFFTFHSRSLLTVNFGIATYVPMYAGQKNLHKSVLIAPGKMCEHSFSIIHFLSTYLWYIRYLYDLCKILGCTYLLSELLPTHHYTGFIKQ